MMYMPIKTCSSVSYGMPFFSITTVQLYFPGFLKSSVYLRFLNELVVMLNRPANQTPASATTLATRGATEATSHLEKSSLSDQIDFAQNLDDPDSLWRRPPTVYELIFKAYHGMS